MQARISTDGQLAQFRSKNRNWENYKKQATSCNSHCFDQKSKLGQLASRWNSCLQNRPIPLDSSRKLTSSSLRQRGCFLSSPGKKACQSVEKSSFVFWNDNSRPQADKYGIGKQKIKVFPFVVLKPAQGSGFYCSVPQPARTAIKMCFSHTALGCCHESSPHRTQIMTRLGGCMLH